jgi:hypothetical protein
MCKKAMGLTPQNYMKTRGILVILGHPKLELQRLLCKLAWQMPGTFRWYSLLELKIFAVVE